MAGRGEISDAAYRLGAGEYYMQTFQGLILGPDGLPIGGTFNYARSKPISPTPTVSDKPAEGSVQ